MWWDGDLQSEILDRTVLTKFNPATGGTDRVLTLYNDGVESNNGTKNNPCLTADIWGDWREEIILRSADNTQLVIFNSTIESEHKIYTLMSDPVYRCAVAWQNVGYNQPPHVGYYLGEGMNTPVQPSISILGLSNEKFSFSSSTTGEGYVNVNDGDYFSGAFAFSAVAAEGWVFDHWSGDYSGVDNPGILDLNADYDVTGHFVTGQEDTGVSDLSDDPGFLCYPTVVEDVVNVGLPPLNGQTAVMSLVDLLGNVVLSKILAPRDPGQVEPVNVAEVPRGVYLLKIQMGERLAIQKIIKK